jgi:uncharacterized protein (DUF488 family)
MIRTVGHGTVSAETFASLMTSTSVDTVLDIRRFPGSRRHPHFGSDQMPQWLAEVGVGYEWLVGLGGRRRVDAGSRNVALRNASFRAYADHMATETFASAVAELVTAAASSAVAIMCSDSLWWRCHRRLVADHLVLVEEVQVIHLFHGGRTAEHPVTPGARRDGVRVIYDGTTG